MASPCGWSASPTPSPRFSPSGKWISYSRSDLLYVVALAGGTPLSLGDKEYGHGQWVPDRDELLVESDRYAEHRKDSRHRPSRFSSAQLAPSGTGERAILSGSTSRFPDITWIFSHGGGMMPFVIERFLTGTAEEIVPGIVTKGGNGAGVNTKNVPKGVLYELIKMYYDTAQSSNPVAMGALRKVVPVLQIVFGTDYWFRTSEDTGKALVNNQIFTAEELRMINRGNAERILPNYRS